MRLVLPSLRRPRHPLARVLLTVLGAAALALLLVFGALALAVFVSVGAIALLFRHLGRSRSDKRPSRPRQAAHEDGRILEGEFVVVRDHSHASR